jgi:hypothetical protein
VGFLTRIQIKGGGGGKNPMSEPMEQVLDPKFQSEM